MRLKTMPASNLDRLIRENQTVYVINTSSMPSGDKGTIIVNFFDGTRREFFKMPPTFIPMAITDSIPSRQLGDSKDFRQCLLKGMLTLVEPTSAEVFLATEEAQDEYEALVLAEHSAAAQGININKPVSQRARVAHYSGEGGAGPMQDITAIDTVSNKVRGLVESLIANTLNAKEVLVQLRRHQSALQPVDFSYILANTTNPDLKKWAKACLSRSTKEDDYEDDVEEPVVEVKAKRKKREKEPKIAAKESKKKETYTDVFDFKEDNNVNEDFRMQQAAVNQQSLYAESKVEQEINEMISGKKKWTPT
jgi:hypothetical protein